MWVKDEQDFEPVSFIVTVFDRLQLVKLDALVAKCINYRTIEYGYQ